MNNKKAIQILFLLLLIAIGMQSCTTKKDCRGSIKHRL